MVIWIDDWGYGMAYEIVLPTWLPMVCFRCHGIHDRRHLSKQHFARRNHLQKPSQDIAHEIKAIPNSLMKFHMLGWFPMCTFIKTIIIRVVFFLKKLWYFRWNHGSHGSENMVLPITTQPRCWRGCRHFAGSVAHLRGWSAAIWLKKNSRDFEPGWSMTKIWKHMKMIGFDVVLMAQKLQNNDGWMGYE